MCKALPLFFFFLYFSTFGAGVEEPLTYTRIEAAIRDKNVSSLFVIKDQLKQKFGGKTALSKLERRLTAEIGMSTEVIERIKKKFEHQPKIGEFLGWFFFPRNEFENTVKTNFNQLPFAERVLVLISADLGFKPARNVIILANNEKINLDERHTIEDLQPLLFIPFMAENGVVVRKFKEILNDAATQDDFFQRFCSLDAGSIAFINAAYIYQFLNRPDIAENLFEEAFNRYKSRRGAVEYGFAILKERDLPRKDEFMDRLRAVEMESYALWKIAQYHRYGTFTSRNLLKANRDYLSALPGGREFPEIFYDAGDFAEYFASSQTDMPKRIRALEQALEHYRLAAEGGIGEAYKRQAEILNKLSVLRSIDLTDKIFTLANHAASNYFVDAASILRERHIEIPTTPAWKTLEQSISIYMNLLKSVKKCSLEF